MAVKVELIARMLAQIKDFQRQLGDFQRQFARAVSRNSPPRTVTFEVDGRPIGGGIGFVQGEFSNGSVEVHCHQNRDLWDALQASKDFEKAFCAIEIPPIKIPDWIAKPEQE